jgi:hypothetical protein
MTTISQKAYAKHRGVAPKTVNTWRRKGRIAALPDGQILKEESDAMLDARPEVYRGGRAKPRVNALGQAVNALGETEEEAIQLDALKEALRRFGAVGMKAIPIPDMVNCINLILAEWDEWERQQEQNRPSRRGLQ